MNSDLDTLLATWIRYAVEKRPEDFWAWDRVSSSSSGSDTEAAWNLVVALVRNAPDEVLGSVGAGPLENLLNAHGAMLVDWIVGEAQRDHRFREALGRAWLSRGTLPPAIENRIVQASGGVLTLLSPQDKRDERVLDPDA